LEVMSVVKFASIVIGFSLFGLFFRKKLFKYLYAIAAKTSWKGDDIIIGVIKAPFLLWCIILGVYTGFNFISLPHDLFPIVNKILFSILIISVTLVVAKISVKFIKLYAEKPGSAMPMTGLTRTLIYGLVLSIGIMILLNTLGISVTPLLTTLGIGGLAVALGLQDTLSNLFAGFYVTAAKQVRVGDYIQLETGEEGYVVDIGWRTTKLKPLHDNLILVPNSKIGQAIITNYYLPGKELAVRVEVGVHYSSDLEKVEKVTCEVATDVIKRINSEITGFRPFIRYHTFDSSSINFTVFLRAREFIDHYLIKHEFIKALHKRYSQEGIVIPFPIRAINYSQEKAE